MEMGMMKKEEDLMDYCACQYLHLYFCLMIWIRLELRKSIPLHVSH